VDDDEVHAAAREELIVVVVERLIVPAVPRQAVVPRPGEIDVVVAAGLIVIAWGHAVGHHAIENAHALVRGDPLGDGAGILHNVALVRDEHDVAGGLVVLDPLRLRREDRRERLGVVLCVGQRDDGELGLGRAAQRRGHRELATGRIAHRHLERRGW